MAKVENAKQRILYVEGNVDGTIGGSFYSLLFLVSGLDRKRFEPIVVFAAPNGLLPRFHAAGIRTEIVPIAPSFRLPGGPAGRLVAKGLNFLRGWLLEPARLAKLLRRERVDLLHLNNSITRNHSWMIGARMAGIPCVTHERGINDVFQPRARKLARGLRAVVCISGAVRDNFHARGLGDLPLVTIYNGLDPREMKVTRTIADVRAEIGVPAGARLVGIVGNIKPWKGQEVVVRAMAELRTRYPDVICLLIGDTSPHEQDYRDRMVALARELGVHEQIRITGYRPDVANYVNALEVQIHASIAPEPFGRVLLEAMALSKPMAASNGGAVPEILVDETTGMLFEPGNPADLARALDYLLADPERAAAMGTAGRARLDAEFSISRNSELTHALYERVFNRQDVTKS